VGSSFRLRACSYALTIAVAFLSLAAPRPALAKRFFIPSEYKTVQAGIDAASPGDTIWVAAGTYPGGIVMKKRLVLFGDAGAENTILDGGDSVRVLHIEGVKSAAVIGFTIRRGKANSGGGIHCVRDTSILFTGCLFQKNWESAISLWESHDINLRESRLEENMGSALAAQSSTVIVAACEFVKNHGYAGGAISFVNSRTVFPMRGCTFEENRADDATGGAINLDASEALLGELVFSKNSAKVAGGAVAGMRGSKLALSRCRFVENRAAASGAVHADASGINIGWSIFVQNGATALGSATGLVGRGQAGINPIIQNNTFYKNASESEGSTLWAEHVSPEIRKNIFVVEGSQRAIAGVETSPLYECNLLHDPTGAALGSLPSADTLVGDPLFCDPEHGNFFLRDLSPAVLASCAPIGALPKQCSSFKMAPSK
jgi:predicted outer membrane repeat protein